MKTVKITTDNTISIVEVNFDDFRSIQEAVGGHFETVHTQTMFNYFKQPMLMIVDEEGHLKGLPHNVLGNYFYDTIRHGCPIAGDFILAVPVGKLLLGLEDAEAMKKQLLKDFRFLEEKVNE